jgi:hypothetical protein
MMEDFMGLKIAFLFLLFILILRMILAGWQKVAVQSPLPFGERARLQIPPEAGVRGYVS